MNEKTWKAAIYLRLSKDDGTSGESSSIKNQREIIRDFLSKNSDIKVVSERIDDGVSGVSFDRPSFNAMIEDVRDRVIDCVIVKDLSRFGRDHIDAGDYIQNIFPFFKVRFIAINDGIDTNSNMKNFDNIMIPFKNLINATYSRDISLKSRSALEIKRKQGQYVGPFVAYGYVKSKENKNKIIIDENVADYVREIFRLKLAGMSADKIASYLNDMGILSPSEYKKSRGDSYSINFDTGSKPKWHAKAVIRILENPLYMGTLVQGKVGKVNYKINKRTKRPQEEWIVFENSHEPIIEKDTFETVRRIMLLDTRTPPEKNIVHNFSGLIHCADCGFSIKRKTINGKAGKKYIYYSCINCKAKNIKEEQLSETILVALRAHIEIWVNAQSIVESMEDAEFSKIRVQKLMKQISFLESEITNKQNYRRSLYEAYVDGRIEEKDYEQFFHDYTVEEDVIRSRIENIKDEIRLISSCSDANTLYINSFKKYQNIEKLTRSVVVELIEDIKITASNQISIVFRYQDELEKLMMGIKSEKVVV
ncbi:MAG: recombinase family protein [Eubacteriales bacterium]